MPYQISKRYTFEASHRLPRHEGKCRNLHGHSYEVEFVFQGATLQDEGSETGMLMDFAVVDKIVKPLIDALDHSHLNKNKLLIPVGKKKAYPTAERIADTLFQAADLAAGYPCVLTSVTVWETKKCWARRIR